MSADAAFTDALAEMLFRLNSAGLATAEVTSALTRAIVRWAHDNGWKVRTEARVDVAAAVEQSRQLGFVDVVIRRGGALPDVAIEIDSTDKPWSVVKLQHAADLGMHAIWVRWGDDAWAGVYDEVDVIQLRAERVARPRRVPNQMTVW